MIRHLPDVSGIWVPASPPPGLYTGPVTRPRAPVTGGRLCSDAPSGMLIGEGAVDSPTSHYGENGPGHRRQGPVGDVGAASRVTLRAGPGFSARPSLVGVVQRVRTRRRRIQNGLGVLERF